MSPQTVARRIAVGMLAGLALGAGVSELTYAFLRQGEDRRPDVIEILIPQGTASRIEEGKPEPSIPATMDFIAGDTLLVRNQDSVAHQLGPVYIPAGSTATLPLLEPQDYQASCSFQPSHVFGLKVRPPLTLQVRILGILQAGVPIGFLFVLYGIFALPVGRRAAAQP